MLHQNRKLARGKRQAVVMEQERQKHGVKQSFKKAVRVSRFSRGTKNEEISNFITSNPSIMLCDLDTLNLIKFKIELNNVDFEIVCDPNVWPENVM